MATNRQKLRKPVGHDGVARDREDRKDPTSDGPEYSSMQLDHRAPSKHHHHRNQLDVAESPIKRKSNKHIRPIQPSLFMREGAWESDLFDNLPEARIFSQHKQPASAMEPTKPRLAKRLRAREDKHLAFTVKERIAPYGAAWAFLSLPIRSDLPDHGSITPKTRLLHRGKIEGADEKMLITLTTPDTREMGEADLIFEMQVGQATDEEGLGRNGLTIPPSIITRTINKKGERGAYFKSERLFSRRLNPSCTLTAQ